METPKKLNAQCTSSTLKQALQDKAFLRALELLENHQKIRLNKGLYPTDYE